MERQRRREGAGGFILPMLNIFITVTVCQLEIPTAFHPVRFGQVLVSQQEYEEIVGSGEP
jgi:hypothetical protein